MKRNRHYYKYINHKGEFAFDKKFLIAMPFREGLVAVNIEIDNEYRLTTIFPSSDNVHIRAK